MAALETEIANLVARQKTYEAVFDDANARLARKSLHCKAWLKARESR